MDSSMVSFKHGETNGSLRLVANIGGICKLLTYRLFDGGVIADANVTKVLRPLGNFLL